MFATLSQWDSNKKQQYTLLQQGVGRPLTFSQSHVPPSPLFFIPCVLLSVRSTISFAARESPDVITGVLPFLCIPCHFHRIKFLFCESRRFRRSLSFPSECIFTQSMRLPQIFSIFIPPPLLPISSPFSSWTANLLQQG